MNRFWRETFKPSVPSTAGYLETSLVKARTQARYVYEQPEDAAFNQYGYARMIQTKLQGSDSDYIGSWHELCLKRHEEICAIPKGGLLTDFVAINCESHQVETIRAGCKYTALSYMWGSGTAPAFRTCLHGIQLENVVEDALVRVRNLGIQYIWTDRYRIDQCPVSRFELLQAVDKIY